jgi:hypothetical protein
VDNFSIEVLPQAHIDLASILQRLVGLPRSLEVSTAMKTAIQRLRTSARSIGEPTNHLIAMKLTVMSLTVPPLYIIYGVHDDRNVVVIKRVIKI